MERLRPTYSNVVATLALFFALAGGAYAASQLPARSVGTKQLRRQAVTPAKLSPKTLAILASREGPLGPGGGRGEQGQQGLPGATGRQDSLVIDARGEVPSLESSSPVTMNGTTSWSAAPGQVGLLFGQLKATLAKETGGYICSAQIRVYDNGNEVGNFFGQQPSEAFGQVIGILAPLPIATEEPGTHTITATVLLVGECKAGSKLDSLNLMVEALGQ